VLPWDARRAGLPLLGALERVYILLLGSGAKHENFDIILKLALAFDEAGIDVVVASGSSSIFAANEPTALRPTFIMPASWHDELAALYKNAMCLTFLSKTEGFGIPTLEAMTTGCPIISNASSLAEVGGDAIAYVAPDDGFRWRDAIVGLSNNENLHATLAAKDRQKPRYSPGNAALSSTSTKSRVCDSPLSISQQRFIQASRSGSRCRPTSCC